MCKLKTDLHTQVQGEVASCLEREDFERLEKICQSEDGSRGDGKRVILGLRNMLAKERAIVKTAAQHEDGADEHYEVNYSAATGGKVQGNIKEAGGSHGKSQHFSKYLTTIKSSEIYERMNLRTICTSCLQKPHEPYITSCFHVYCKDCLSDLMHDAVSIGEERASCMKEGCNIQIQASKPIGMDREASQSSDGGRKKKGEAKDEMADWLDLDGQCLASTKTIAAKAQILNWWDPSLPGGNPDAKVIIFTQWRGMVKVLSKMCKP